MYEDPSRKARDGAGLLGDEDLAHRWRDILDVYEEFLSWKERDDVEFRRYLIL